MASSSPAFGRYRPLFRLGAGGMAEVWAARFEGEAGFSKLVAVKRMHPHLASDASCVAMFLDEARLAASITSPHVVPTLDLGRAEDGSPFLVMELVLGVPLSDALEAVHLAGRTIPVEVVVELIVQAAAGLHDAHEARAPDGTPLGLVHRDVSPHNILVGGDGRARITDFGVAYAAQRLTTTRTAQLKGKASYLAPEQIAPGAVDRRADVFALGIVAWECLALTRLFPGDNLLAVVDRVRTATIPSLDAVRDDVPVPIAEVIARALERPRERRFATALDFATALRAAAAAAELTPSAGATAAWVRSVAGEKIAALDRRARGAEGGAAIPDGDEGEPTRAMPVIPATSSNRMTVIGWSGAGARPARRRGRGVAIAAAAIAAAGIAGAAAWIVASGPAASEEPPRAAVAATTGEATRSEVGAGGSAPEAEPPAPAAAPAAGPPEPGLVEAAAPGSAAAEARRPRRTRRARRATTATAAAPEPSERSGGLLGVSEFDRQSKIR